MHRMMILITSEDLSRLAVLAHRRMEATGEDLARAYRREAARLLSERLQEVDCGTKVDAGAGETNPAALGADAAATESTGDE